MAPVDHGPMHETPDRSKRGAALYEAGVPPPPRDAFLVGLHAVEETSNPYLYRTMVAAPPTGGWTFVREEVDDFPVEAIRVPKFRALKGLYGKPLRQLPARELLGKPREAAFHKYRGARARAQELVPIPMRQPLHPAWHSAAAASIRLQGS